MSLWIGKIWLRSVFAYNFLSSLNVFVKNVLIGNECRATKRALAVAKLKMVNLFCHQYHQGQEKVQFQKALSMEWILNLSLLRSETKHYLQMWLKPDKTRVTKKLRLNCLYLLKRQVIFCYWMHTFLTMLVTIIPIDLDGHSFLVSTGSMREISIKVTLHVDTCSVNHPDILNFSFSQHCINENVTNQLAPQ